MNVEYSHNVDKEHNRNSTRY